MKKRVEELDIYEKDNYENFLDNDLWDETEEGFMIGYLAA